MKKKLYWWCKLLKNLKVVFELHQISGICIIADLHLKLLFWTLEHRKKLLPHKHHIILCSTGSPIELSSNIIFSLLINISFVCHLNAVHSKVLNVSLTHDRRQWRGKEKPSNFFNHKKWLWKIFAAKTVQKWKMVQKILILPSFDGLSMRKSSGEKCVAFQPCRISVSKSSYWK